MKLIGHVKRTFQRLGLDVSHYRPLRSDPFVAQQQLMAGRPCRSIFDVGAYHGDITERYANLFPLSQIHAFEPYPPSYNVLSQRFEKQPRIQSINAAVSSRSGEGTFHVNRDPTTNSLLATGIGAAVATAITVNEIKVPVMTLDDYCQRHKLPAPDILKFDIQGNELEALRGAEETLGRQGPLLIYTEVLFERLYENCAMFGDLLEFLGARGYTLFNLYSLHRAPSGQLEFGDALFISQQLRG